MEVLILFIVSIVVFNYVHEFGHLLGARLAGIRVAQAFVGVGPILHARTAGSGTQFLFGAIPVASMRFDPDSYAAAAPQGRLFAAFAGPLANFAATFLLFASAYLMYPGASPAVVNVVDTGGAAATAGLQSGDRIVRVDGRQTDDWQAVGLAFIDRVGDTGALEITVDRAGGVRAYEVPIRDWQSRQARIDAFGSLGISPMRSEQAAGNPLVGIGAALWDTIKLGWETAVAGIRMLVGTISVLNFGGGLQTTQLGLDASDLNFGDYLRLLGLFSMAFGIINLLPGPVVDGLAMVKAAVAWVAGTPLSGAADRALTVVGSILAFGPIPLCIVHEIIRFT